MSLLDTLQPIYTALPEVKPPEKKVEIKKRIMWTVFALIVFFIMGNITVFGLKSESAGELERLQALFASEMGTLISAGIGPIVLASIVLQLLVGAKIINIDLTNTRDRARFQGLQKLFAIILCFFEALILTSSGVLVPQPGFFLVVVLQVALGSLVLLYLDELVSKYGIGSGIGLFIAAGVSGSFFWQVFRPPIPSEINPNLKTGGLLWSFITTLATGADYTMLVPILVAAIIFLVIVFAEGMHVNIPITMGRSGLISRYPVKLLYVSNMPVILAVALFANVRLWAKVTEGIPIMKEIMNGIRFRVSTAD